MKPALRTLNRERASDSAYEALRECILSQTFQPGERLNVKELATRLGVSLTPVKEAINRLALEGLVAINPRSGTYVTEISSEELAETFDLRVALECLAAEKCVERVTAKDLEEIGKIVRALNAPVTTDRERELHEKNNHEFHDRLVALSGNRKLLETYRSLNAHIKIARVHYGREGWQERIERERREHDKIFDALKNRDGRGLACALRRHIRQASESLIEDLERNGSCRSREKAKAS